MKDKIKPTYSKEWLEFERQSGGRHSISSSNVQECREAFSAVFKALEPLLPPPSDGVRIEDNFTSTGVRIRIHTPTTPSKDPLPLGLYIHSGGWFTGSIGFEDYQCRYIAETTPMIIFSPEYRLAPENPFPKGLEDCCAAYEYMHNSGLGDARKKFIMGGSAGGNLTACVALKYARNADLRPNGIIAACMTACDPEFWSEELKKKCGAFDYGDTAMINEGSVRLAREWYQAPPSDPLYSPLLHPDIKHLSKVHVVATTADPTYFETKAFYEECRRQGVDTQIDEWTGMPHFFWIIPTLPQSSVFMKKWCEVLRKMCQK